MSEWSHLPNAAHIDWVISDLGDNHNDWDAAHRGAAYLAARDAARGAAYEAACDAALDAARNAAWWAASDAVLDAARDAAYLAARDAAYHACLALVAYDHAGALFDRPLEQVRVMAYLGQPAAILMLPACRIKEKRRELICE